MASSSSSQEKSEGPTVPVEVGDEDEATEEVILVEAVSDDDLEINEDYCTKIWLEEHHTCY